MKQRLGWIWLTALILLPPLIIAGLVFWRNSPANAAGPALEKTEMTVEYGRQAPRLEWPMKTLTEVPPAPSTQDPFRMDLRSADARRLDLSGHGANLLAGAIFDTRTLWPATLPAEFQPNRLMEEGKDPGLGVRALHKQGITGAGVNVAYIGQTLWRGHPEYGQAIDQYTELGRLFGTEWFGEVSVLAGKSSGVAPGATVQYYAVQIIKDAASEKRTFAYIASAIERVLDGNRTLPKAKQVRVICAPIGASPEEEGYAALNHAYQRARREGVLIVTTDMDSLYPYQVMGLGRKPYSDPNSPESYTVASWQADFWFRNGGKFHMPGSRPLFVPMEGRAVAVQTGPDFGYFPRAGMGIAVPWGAGLYALAVQVRPSVTPEQFLEAAYKTGDYVPVSRNGFDYRLGPIVNPNRLIDHLKRGSGTS